MYIYNILYPRYISNYISIFPWNIGIPIISLVVPLYPIHFTNYIKLYGRYFRPLYTIPIQLIIYILPELSSYCISYIYIYISIKPMMFPIRFPFSLPRIEHIPADQPIVFLHVTLW